MKKKERAVVLSQECIATDIYSMWIETPDIAAEAIPGQFITLYTKDADKLLGNWKKANGNRRWNRYSANAWSGKKP